MIYMLFKYHCHGWYMKMRLANCHTICTNVNIEAIFLHIIIHLCMLYSPHQQCNWPGLSLPAIYESVEMIMFNTRLWLKRSWVLGFHLLTNSISLSMRFLVLPSHAMQSWVFQSRITCVGIRGINKNHLTFTITWRVMGVPAFFRWLSRKYPSIVVHCIEEKVSIAYFN